MDPAVRVEELAKKTPGLELLILHGSRARGDAHTSSDWDLAYLADATFDHLGLVSRLAAVLGTEEIDLVNLATAGGLLRHRAASEGRLLYERITGAHERFVLEAVRFWLDAGPAIRESQEAVLRGLT